jgi:hypothetical protein
MQQQTTLIINDNLFIQAAQLTSIQDKNQLVELALTEFIKNHQATQKLNLLDLYGKGGIREDYDYKKLRTEEDNHVLG